MIIDTYEEMIDELRETDVGRDVIAEGLEQGRLDAVTEVLGARFDDADADRVNRTATRLVVELGRFAARSALTINDLDA